MTPDTEDQSGWLDELADSIITMIGNPDYHQQGSIKIIKTMVSQHEAGVVRAADTKGRIDELKLFEAKSDVEDEYLQEYITDRLAELSAAPQDIKPLAQWKPYKGAYEKRWYDIKLTSGAVLLDCWPNAGTFHSWWDDSGYISGSQVVEFRETDDPYFRPENVKGLSRDADAGKKAE